MKLNEILVESKEELLDEDFGTLNFLDKKFDKAFKNKKQVKVPHDSETGYKDKTVYFAPDRAGKNSKVDDLPFKTNASGINTVDDKETVAVVFCSGDNQLFLVRKIPGNRHNDATTYNLSIDIPLISSLIEDGSNEPDEISDEVAELINQIGLIFGTTEKQYAPRRQGPGGRSYRSGPTTSKRVAAKLSDIETRNCTSPQFQKFTGLILKTFKLRKIDLQMKVIKADETRKPINIARQNARHKSIPTGTLPGEFIKKAKESLKTRLDVYKSSKAVGVDRIEDLITAIREKGYLDKMKVQGFAYDQQRSEIRMEYLKNPSSRDYCYVEYAVNQDTPEYGKYSTGKSAIWAKYRGDKADREAFDKELAEYKAQFPPMKFKVILKLDKGTIVPSEIRSEKEYY